MFKNLSNLSGLMKQAQEFQSKMAEAQEKVAQIQVTGQSGGGLVKVTLDGKHKLVALDLDPSLIKGDEKEVLEDLIVAAHNDALQTLEEKIQSEMGQVTSGLPLPPGFKLPF